MEIKEILRKINPGPKCKTRLLYKMWEYRKSEKKIKFTYNLTAQRYSW